MSPCLVFTISLGCIGVQIHTEGGPVVLSIDTKRILG